MKRLEARKASLDKSVTNYNVSSLVGKQVDYNLLDNQMPVITAYITALQARRAVLADGSLRVNE